MGSLDEIDSAALETLSGQLEEYNARENPFSFPITPELLNKLYLRLIERRIIDAEHKPVVVKGNGSVGRFVNLVSLSGAVQNYSAESFLEVLAHNTNNRLALSLNKACEKLCSNCASNSTRDGQQLDYNLIERIDPRFLSFIHTIGFGMEGEPFFYQSGKRNLGDIVACFFEKGIRQFDFLTGGFFPENPIYELAVDRLDEVKKRAGNAGIKYGLEITYCNYGAELEMKNFSFFYTLELLSRISPEVNVKVLGDRNNLVQTFGELTEVLENAHFNIEKNRGKVSASGKVSGREINIRSIYPSAIYPQGRAKSYSSELFHPENGIPPLCKHLGYDEIYVDINGNMRFCTEVVSYDKKAASNLYLRSFEELIDDLDRFHAENYHWLRENMQEIMTGAVRSCMCRRR
jgi:hypothetical protein